jgi:uncharacterized protein YfdQ (DUF2303 family)
MNLSKFFQIKKSPKIQTSRVEKPKGTFLKTLLNEQLKVNLKSKGFLERTKEESLNYKLSKQDTIQSGRQEELRKAFLEKMKPHENLKNLVGNSLPLLTPKRVLNLKSSVRIFVTVSLWEKI